MVAAIAITDDRKQIERQLQEIERRSGKALDDWHISRPKTLRRYFDEALAIERLARAIHFRVYERIEPVDYHGYGIATILDVADLFQPVSIATFIPEGFNRSTRDRLERVARSRFDRAKVWSGGFYGCSIVRLADAVAGLIGENRFRTGSKKHFPEFASALFIELKTKPPGCM